MLVVVVYVTLISLSLSLSAYPLPIIITPSPFPVRSVTRSSRERRADKASTSFPLPLSREEISLTGRAGGVIEGEGRRSWYPAVSKVYTNTRRYTRNEDKVGNESKRNPWREMFGPFRASSVSFGGLLWYVFVFRFPCCTPSPPTSDTHLRPCP